MADQIKYTNKLSGARILIIGASSGLGYGVAEACIENGALVAAASSNPSRVNSAVEKLKSAYPSKTSNIHGLVVNLSKTEILEQELEKLFKEAVGKIGGADGKLDHVIFTAGDALAMMKIQDMDINKIIQAGNVRFFAPLLAAKFVEIYLVPSPKSSYTITTGAIGERPNADWTVIGSYSGGHHAMVRNLAVDLKPIRVNGVAPGAVVTSLWNQIPEEQRQGVFESLAEKVLVGKVGAVEDVVETYLAILKDGNMDGTIIRTDGGGTIV
ncbi:short chain dehydrogenase [Massarina eburnea CBS 473.64]|uniref:Short chain dehydrogenase n=1 Tax=Massarina eburnea CBS 473.64 TaxID=1395130 RepID=A0A6A6SJD9_9PLEO|nr:short chain dehydrogenase [Massarina eburnea CBS 473.64]